VLLQDRPPFVPTDLGAEIFTDRYTIRPDESYAEGAQRLGTFVSSVESDVGKWSEAFSDIIGVGALMPGGRIWYGCGRPVAQLLNCYVIPTTDSREGWAKMVGDNIIIAGTGGGLGENYSNVRPRGAKINGTGGFATGAVSVMKIENAALEEIRSGSSRRAARMFCLNINHPDIMEFIHAKMDLNQLNNGNASVVFDFSPEEFFAKVDADEPLDLVFRGTVHGTVRAKELWNKIVRHALDNGEPGVLNGFLANRDSNISYCRYLVSTNPCFSGDTLIHTDEGHFPIKSLVGKAVRVWDGESWVTCDNFRKTGEQQPTLRLTLQDGSEVVATPYHSFILEDGTRRELKDLSVGDRLRLSDAPTSDGQLHTQGAYAKGFLVGDGTFSKASGYVKLQVYAPKYVCEDRLVTSLCEIDARRIKATHIKTDVYLNAEVGYGRRDMAGLIPRSWDLNPWVTEYKYKLPDEVFQWDRHSRLEFIAGLMDADGTVMDSANGFGYQLSSISKTLLHDVQTLLKTVGVYSKLALTKAGGRTDFKQRGGVCTVQPLWRLTISQSSAIKLSSQITFSRLESLANKTTLYTLKGRRGQVVSIDHAGVQDVYCCTIPSTHSLALSVGIQVGQCGEQWLQPYSTCCLGALVLPRFLKNSRSKNFKDRIDWEYLHHAATISVRFLDDVLSATYYPIAEVKQESLDTRRIGLGVMGVHYMLLRLGVKYSSPEGRAICSKIAEFIKHAAYDASTIVASEKGPFPLWDAKKAFNGDNFISRLKPSMKSKIKTFGIRNCSILTIAPTGTTAMVQGVSSGVEPIFAPAYKRRYYKDGIKTSSVVVDPLFKEMVQNGEDVSQFESAAEISPEDHLEMQVTWQHHIDNAVSKTITIPQDRYTGERMDALYRTYLPKVKGLTVYPEGSRPDAPLERLPFDEAVRLAQSSDSITAISDDCRTGTCTI
jgi:ribonucleoside-diphosphate reductase alpha chain